MFCPEDDIYHSFTMQAFHRNYKTTTSTVCVIAPDTSGRDSIQNENLWRAVASYVYIVFGEVRQGNQDDLRPSSIKGVICQAQGTWTRHEVILKGSGLHGP